jgi:hypothetical protein
MEEELYSGVDLVAIPFYAALIFFLGRRVQQQRIQENPLYKYYTRGLIAKIVSGLLVCLVYIFYYKGGDTIGYFQSARLVSRMIFINPGVYFSVMGGTLTHENLSVFYFNDLCCPDYWKDPQSFTVVRFASPLMFLSGFNFFVTTFLFAWLSYGGIFRLFLLFNELFPGMEKKFATSVLFMPSVLFWGSAILKDTLTFSAACWMTWSIYKVFIKPERRGFHIMTLVIAAYIIISIKPYIFVAMLPGATIWIIFQRITKIGSTFVRVLISPAIIVVGVLASTFLISSFSTSLGEYGSVDKAINKAVVTKNDLTRDAYGENSFDIGELDGSVGSLLSKFPVAIVAGLFRPFLWDVSNPVMLISALENTFMILLTLRVLLLLGPGFFIRISANPVLIFCFVFSIFFAFALGLTTANFGALVRYKIPSIPFFLSMLYILENQAKQARLTSRQLREMEEEKENKSLENELVTS